jgi:hypothetical protein
MRGLIEELGIPPLPWRIVATGYGKTGSLRAQTFRDHLSREGAHHIMGMSHGHRRGRPDSMGWPWTKSAW